MYGNYQFSRNSVFEFIYWAIRFWCLLRQEYTVKDLLFLNKNETVCSNNSLLTPKIYFLT